jgi:hypothetical protein
MQITSVTAGLGVVLNGWSTAMGNIWPLLCLRWIPDLHSKHSLEFGA